MELNLDIIQNMTLGAAAIVPIILSLCQVVKMAGWIQDKYTPFLALGLGVLITFLLADNFREDISATILTGMLMGLAASGLYSGVKASAHAINAERRKNSKSKRDDW